MSILTILFALILVGVLFWGVRAISGAFGIPPQIVVVVQVILVVLCLIWIMSALGVVPGGNLRLN